MPVKNICICLTACVLLFVTQATAASQGTSDVKLYSVLEEQATELATTVLYQCPMKCEGEKTYTTQGSCPVCGMTLQEIKMNDIEPETHSKHGGSWVHIVGAMKNVMHKGELFGNITLDTISNRLHLFGLGPVEYLAGEILINDGKAYVASIASDQSSIHMEETYHTKAPFFVYANVDKWSESTLPDSISSIPELEKYLDEVSSMSSRPFVFKVAGIVENASIHVTNLPKGSEVHSPEDAHIGQKDFTIKNEVVELIGFFSTEHQGVFTHHDTFVHIHLITANKSNMGHLDALTLKKGTAKLFLPI